MRGFASSQRCSISRYSGSFSPIENRAVQRCMAYSGATTVSSPLSQGPSHSATASQSRAGSRLLPPCSVRALRRSCYPSERPAMVRRAIRQRPFGIAADRQRRPLLVRAPHRRLRCMGNLFCMGRRNLPADLLTCLPAFLGNNPRPRDPDAPLEAGAFPVSGGASGSTHT